MDTLSNPALGQKLAAKDLLNFIESPDGLKKLLTHFPDSPGNGTANMPPWDAATIATRPGAFISSFPLRVPYNYGTDLQKTPIFTLNGSSTPFYGIVAQADKAGGELNLAVLMGKWFYWNYNPLGVNFPYVLTNTAAVQMQKTITFTPFDRDTFLIADISGNLPEDPVLSMFTGRALADVPITGIQANFSAALSLFDGINYISSPVVQDTIIQSVKVSGDEELAYIFKPVVHYKCILKIPAHVSEVTFDTKLTGLAFTSDEIIALLSNNNINQYALAMLDLRNVELHRHVDIIMNPLSGDVWRPSGGLRLEVDLGFYEVDNILAL